MYSPIGLSCGIMVVFSGVKVTIENYWAEK